MRWRAGCDLGFRCTSRIRSKSILRSCTRQLWLAAHMTRPTHHPLLLIARNSAGDAGRGCPLVYAAFTQLVSGRFGHVRPCDQIGDHPVEEPRVSSDVTFHYDTTSIWHLHPHSGRGGRHRLNPFLAWRPAGSGAVIGSSAQSRLPVLSGSSLRSRTLGMVSASPDGTIARREPAEEVPRHLSVRLRMPVVARALVRAEVGCEILDRAQRVDFRVDNPADQAVPIL